MNDSFVSKFIAECAKPFAEKIGKLLEQAGIKLKAELEEKAAARAYMQNYAERHGKIKVLGMSEPLNLTDIYTTVRAVSPRRLKAFISPKEMEEQFKRRNQRGSFNERGKAEDAIEAANRIPCLTILGQPGGGKSTFLRRIGLEALACRATYTHPVIPVFVELRTLKNLISSGQRRREDPPSMDLIEAIRHEFLVCGFPRTFADWAISEGKLLVLLDGVDEVPEEVLDLVIDEVRDFVDRYHLNRFIISCRTASYNNFFPRFSDVELADFDNEQISSFISNWFRSERDQNERTARQFWDKLNEPNHAATLDLARTPLLLVYLCWLYDESQSLPANRSDLYEEALRILLDKWAAEKRIRRDAAFQGLSSKMEVILLQSIAGPAVMADRSFFTEKELLDGFELFLENVHNAPKMLESTSLLKAIVEQQGLLVARAHGLYSFSHQTIQEYLAARQFIGQGSVEKIIEDHFFERRWREVFLMISGIGVEDYLQKLTTKLHREVSRDPLLCKLIRWVDDHVSKDGGAARSCSRRAAAFYVIRYTLTEVFAIFGFHGLEGYSEEIVTNGIEISPYRRDPDLLVSLSTDPAIVTELQNIRDALVKIRSHSSINLFMQADCTTISEAMRTMITSFKRIGMFNVRSYSRVEKGFEHLVRRSRTIPDDASPFEWKISLLQELVRTIAIDLDVDETQRLFRRRDCLQNYFYGLLLILDCIDAALLIPNDAWEQVSLGMFTLPPP